MFPASDTRRDVPIFLYISVVERHVALCADNQGNTIKSMGFKTNNDIFWLLQRLVCTYKKGLQEGQLPPP